MNKLSLALADGAIVARRNLIKIKRVPDILVFTLMSPIMFVLLFAYVFGGSIDLPGDLSYREFLLAGIFVQTVIFGSTFSGAGMADDMQKGIIDRFRSLPMSPAAVLVGRTGSDIANNVLSLCVMSATGLLVNDGTSGCRVHGNLSYGNYNRLGTKVREPFTLTGWSSKIERDILMRGTLSDVEIGTNNYR